MRRTTLRVLCIEDAAIDAELLEAHLSLSEFEVTLKRVDTAEDLRKALKESTWDIALADYSLPRFSAPLALQVIKEVGVDLPVIVVSGTIGENRAIEMMRAGAHDFIVKGDFLRLIPAIKRELGEAANRKARRQAETDLAISQDSFLQLADAMPQLVWTAAPDGQVTYANQRCYQYTGLQDEQLLGWAWKSIVRPLKSLTESAEQMKSGQDLSIEHQLRGADGTYRWFLTRATPGRDLNGKIRVWYATSTDIHEQKMFAEELQKAKLLAEQANEAKSAFLANMSHEIRTPLGAIIGFADLIDDPNIDAAQRADCVARIRKNGELLSKVINEVLDLSKIESQKLEMDRVSFELHDALEDIRNVLDLKTKEKGLQLEFSQIGQLPSRIISDPTRLRQILINIVGNAVKFTDHGKITVVTRLRKESPQAKEGLLEFEVTDTGIGISQEQASRLFQPFVQADNSMTRKYGGTGLGLNLSRKLAQVMGGDVFLAKSKPGEGSTFVCTVLIGLSNEISGSSVEGSGSDDGASYDSRTLVGCKVLVIDDLPENRLLVHHYLSLAGAETETAENGQIGIEKALSGFFDVILLDIHMPVMNGFETVRKLRAQNYTSPIVALTADTIRGDREKCLKAGFTEHLNKPIDRAEMILLIQKLSK